MGYGLYNALYNDCMAHDPWEKVAEGAQELARLDNILTGV